VARPQSNESESKYMNSVKNVSEQVEVQGVTDEWRYVRNRVEWLRQARYVLSLGSVVRQLLVLGVIQQFFDFVRFRHVDLAQPAFALGALVEEARFVIEPLVDLEHLAR